MLQVQNISFGSTYRIPLSERNVTPRQKDKVKNFSDNYEHHLHRNCRLGWVRISVPEELDEQIEKGLRDMGFKIYQKFDAHDLPNNKIDNYIKTHLPIGEYKQFGKHKQKLHPKAKYELKQLRSIAELINDGYSISDIAKATGHQEAYIKKIVKKYNVTPEQKAV